MTQQNGTDTPGIRRLVCGHRVPDSTPDRVAGEERYWCPRHEAWVPERTDPTDPRRGADIPVGRRYTVLYIRANHPNTTRLTVPVDSASLAAEQARAVGDSLPDCIAAMVYTPDGTCELVLSRTAGTWTTPPCQPGQSRRSGGTWTTFYPWQAWETGGEQS
jgi:hypothetical protein